MRWIYLLALSPLLIGAVSPPDKQTLASAAPYIDKANHEWTQAIVTGDAEVLAAPYATNGVFVGPDGSEVRGHDAVQAMYAQPRPVKVLRANIHSDGRVAADPDDVYEWGAVSMTIERDGKSR